MSINIKQYGVSEAYQNGRRVHFNENAVMYDGKKLSLYRNTDGMPEFQQLSNEETEQLLQDVHFHNKIPLTKRLLMDFPKPSKRRRRSRSKKRSSKRQTKRRKSRSKRGSTTRKRKRDSIIPSILKTIY